VFTASRRSLVYRDHYANADKKQFRRAKIIIGCIAAILLIQSIFHIPAFRLSAIDVRGLQYLSADELRPFIDSQLMRRRFVLFRNDNYFLFNARSLVQELEQSYFMSIRGIHKIFPNKLVLDVHEQVGGFVVQESDGYFTVDRRGARIEDTPAPPQGMTVLADERVDRSKPVAVAYLEQAAALHELWNERVPRGFIIAAFNMNDENDRMTLTTDKGFKVYFNTQLPIDVQVDRFVSFVSDASYEQPREYVDLRFGESLYIR